MKGKFITFEGIEGSGKSTQVEMLAADIREGGKEVLITREPGGTDVGDQIREILLNPKNISILPVTELLLYAAARAQHVDGKIKPALEEGKIVLSDRYADATEAYQGAARELPAELLKRVHEIATKNLIPDLTFLLDLSASAGLKRARDRNEQKGKQDRFENEEIAFHERVREGYLAIAKKEPERVVVIDASGSVDETYQAIKKAYVERNNRT